MATQAPETPRPTVQSAYKISPIRAFEAPHRQRLSVVELCDAYMAAYTGTDRSRAPTLARWCAYLGEWIAADLDADVVDSVLQDMAATPIRRYLGKDDAGNPIYREYGLPRPASLNRFKATFSSVLTWAQTRRLMPKGWHNPCREIRSLKPNNERTRFLTEAERTRLLRVCRISSWPRLYLLVLMGITTGARKGELMGLRYRDLNLDAGTAHLFKTKNGTERVLPLPPGVVQEIRKHGKAPHPDTLLFARAGHPDRPFNFTKPWAQALADARIDDFKFHDLRHTCASYLAQQGGSLLDIAAVLGHKQLDVTRRYAHLTIDSKAALVGRVMGDIG